MSTYRMRALNPAQTKDDESEPTYRMRMVNPTPEADLDVLDASSSRGSTRRVTSKGQRWYAESNPAMDTKKLKNRLLR